MALITLIGEKLASKDIEFIYIGPNNDCRNCKLKTVCFNLKIGRKYKITNVRDKKHNCNVFEGTATVVEVEELPIITSINKKHTKGSKSIIEKPNCNCIGCNYYKVCNVTLKKDHKYTIKSINKSIDCPRGYEIVEAELEE